MTDYISVPIETDPQVLKDAGFLILETNIADWEASDGQLDVILISVAADMVAEARDIASDVPTTIYRDFGTNIMQIVAIDEASASVTSTWTATDSDGHTLPAGTLIILRNPDGLEIPFLVTEDVVIPNGANTTSAGEVNLEADEGTGSDGNGCENTPSPELVDSLSWVDTITIVGASSGGEDPETDAEYLDRLKTELQLMAPRPIVARDFAVLALRIAGVDRASVIDGYNLDTSTPDQDKCVTVIVADEDGNAVAAGVKDDVDDYLQEQREVNFLVFVGDPTYNTVQVVYVATARTGWDTTDVQERADIALEELLSPTGWGLPSTNESQNVWANVSVLRGQELYTVLNNVEGLDYVTALSFGAQRSATGVNATDIITSASHGYLANAPIKFVSKTGGSSIVVDTTYYVRDVTTNTFKISATPGGVALDLGSDITVGVVVSLDTVDTNLVGIAPLPQPGTISGTVNAP